MLPHAYDGRSDGEVRGECDKCGGITYACEFDEDDCLKYVPDHNIVILGDYFKDYNKPHRYVITDKFVAWDEILSALKGTAVYEIPQPPVHGSGKLSKNKIPAYISSQLNLERK